MLNKNFLTKSRWLVTIILLLVLSTKNAWGTLTADSVASSKTTSLVSGGKYVIRAGSTQTKYLAAKDGTWGTSVAIGSAYVFTVQGDNSGFIATCKDGTLTPATSNFSAYGSATSANLKLTNDGYIQNKSSTSYYLQANGSSSYKFRWYNSSQTKALMYQVGYNIHFTQPGSGSIAATSSAGTFDSDNNIMAGMYATKTATLTAIPPSGKTVNAWTVKKKSDNSDITATVLSGTTLTMPAYDVVVSVTWKDACTPLGTINGSFLLSTCFITI